MMMFAMWPRKIPWSGNPDRKESFKASARLNLPCSGLKSKNINAFSTASGTGALIQLEKYLFHVLRGWHHMGLFAMYPAGQGGNPISARPFFTKEVKAEKYLLLSSSSSGVDGSA